MIDPRKQAFAHYFRALADLMGARDWTVGVVDDPPDSNHVAEVDCRYGRKLAWFALSETFLDATPEAQRQTACHEVMHLHFEPMRRMLMGLLEDNIWEAVNLPFEYGIDASAEMIAPFMPLPDDVLVIPPEPPDMAKMPAKPKAQPAAKKVQGPKPATPAGKGGGKGAGKMAPPFKAKKKGGK